MVEKSIYSIESKKRNQDTETVPNWDYMQDMPTFFSMENAAHVSIMKKHFAEMEVDEINSAFEDVKNLANYFDRKLPDQFDRRTICERLYGFKITVPLLARIEREGYIRSLRKSKKHKAIYDKKPFIKDFCTYMFLCGIRSAHIKKMASLRMKEMWREWKKTKHKKPMADYAS